MNDSLLRSNIVLKFVAFKTPSTSSVQFPKSLFFTFKFFTFTTIQTDLVHLHIEKEIKPANQYYLVLPDQLKMRQMQQKQDFESVLESALQQTFFITEDQHFAFANYMKDSMLSIDVWDGEGQKHYGTGRL